MEENQIYKQMYTILFGAANQVINDYANGNSMAKSLDHLKATLESAQRPMEVAKSDDLRTHPGDWLTLRTSVELTEIRAEWYRRAKQEGITGQCAHIARTLGHDPAKEGYVSNGRKYVWESDGVKIYLDDYGNYMTVHHNGKEVCSTHETSKLFVPGEWVIVIDRVYPAAQERGDRNKIESDEKYRQRLIDQLSLPE